jgi:hypothetical protein
MTETLRGEPRVIDFISLCSDDDTATEDDEDYVLEIVKPTEMSLMPPSLDVKPVLVSDDTDTDLEPQFVLIPKEEAMEIEDYYDHPQFASPPVATLPTLTPAPSHIPVDSQIPEDSMRANLGEHSRSKVASVFRAPEKPMTFAEVCADVAEPSEPTIVGDAPPLGNLTTLASVSSAVDEAGGPSTSRDVPPDGDYLLIPARDAPYCPMVEMTHVIVKHLLEWMPRFLLEKNKALDDYEQLHYERLRSSPLVNAFGGISTGASTSTGPGPAATYEEVPCAIETIPSGVVDFVDEDMPQALDLSTQAVNQDHRANDSSEPSDSLSGGTDLLRRALTR